MMKKRYNFLNLIILVLIISSCSSYRANIMFKTPENHINEWQNMVWQTDSLYTVQKFDLLNIKIYNKGGELLIDPAFVASGNLNTLNQLKNEILYQVDDQGKVKLPLVGELVLLNMTSRQAEKYIEEQYTQFYDKVFAHVSFMNKRAYVFRNEGTQIIPIQNENTTLIEIIAMSGGMDNLSIANNVRLIRGDEVIVGDLTTIDGYRTFNRKVLPGDIIYIEPIRRPVAEGLRDYGTVVGLITSIISLTALIISFK